MPVNPILLRGWDKLQPREQNFIRGVLAGQGPSLAAKVAGVNFARMKKNAKVMQVLWHAQQEQAKPTAKSSTDSDEGLSIYERAAALEKQIEAEQATWTKEQWDAYHAANRARAREEEQKRLEGRVCKGCAKPAELLVGTEPWCRACREVPVPKPEPDPQPPTDAKRPAVPVAPREPNLPSAATRTAITTALVHDFWERERAREAEPAPALNWMDHGIPCFR